MVAFKYVTDTFTSDSNKELLGLKLESNSLFIIQEDFS